MELRYRRIDKEKATSSSGIVDTSSTARVDTVAIYVPDIWSVMPTKIEFEELQTLLKSQLDTKLVDLDKKPEETPPPPQPTPIIQTGDQTDTTEKAAAATDVSATQQVQ